MYNLNKKRFDLLSHMMIEAKQKNQELRDELGIDITKIESFNAVLLNVVPMTIDDLEVIVKALEDYNSLLERDVAILTLGRGVRKYG